MSDATSRANEILARIREAAPPDPKLQNYIAALEQQLAKDNAGREELEKLISEYEEAYAKLTAPANRTGVFLNWLDDDQEQAMIALGDTEYVVLVDPKVDKSLLERGKRLKLNEAYAVVGLLPDSESGPIVKVGEVLDESRIRLGSDAPQAGGGRIVLRGAALKEVKIEAGDELRLEPSGRVAIEHIPKQEVRDYFFEDVPEMPWEKVGGQQHAIRLIRETIEHPLLHPEIYEKYDKKPIKGILLFGPPGCGKTLIGKATAYNLTKEYSKRVGHEVKEYFMYISGPKILNMWLGETERMVREIFATAREKAKEGRLVFIFMDEAESVLRTRSSGRWLNISNTVVPQFCAELDGLVSLDNVVLMLTSNRPDYIDPAVLRPERIDRKVKITRPDKDASRQILSIYLKPGLPLDPELMKKFQGEEDCARAELIENTTDYIWRKAKETEFLKVSLRNGSTDTLHWKDLVSGALLKSVVDRAKEYAIRRAVSDPEKPNGITQEDLERSVAAEYKENEIFPKTDTQDDWLKLLDYEADNVASVKAVGRNRGEEFQRKNIL